MGFITVLVIGAGIIGWALYVSVLLKNRKYKRLISENKELKKKNQKQALLIMFQRKSLFKMKKNSCNS